MVVVNILDGLALTKFVVKPALVIIFQKKILREKKNDDLVEKRATYLNKVNKLTQEFYFAHP